MRARDSKIICDRAIEYFLAGFGCQCGVLIEAVAWDQKATSTSGQSVSWMRFAPSTTRPRNSEKSCRTTSRRRVEMQPLQTALQVVRKRSVAARSSF